MARMSCWIIPAVIVLLAIPIRASGQFATFQHGGRGTAQAGALTARAVDASSVFYNPAALTQLDDVQIQLGVGVDLLRANYTQNDGRALFVGIPIFRRLHSWHSIQRVRQSRLALESTHRFAFVIPM